MNGKGSGRRQGANDQAYKASPAIPESPRFRKKPLRTAQESDTVQCPPHTTPACGKVCEEVPSAERCRR